MTDQPRLIHYVTPFVFIALITVTLLRLSEAIPNGERLINHGLVLFAALSSLVMLWTTLRQAVRASGDFVARRRITGLLADAEATIIYAILCAAKLFYGR